MTNRITLCPRLLGPLLLSLVSTTMLPAAAQVCSVPTQKETFQSAVDDASCDTIVLARGRYVESVTIGRDLKVRASGAASTRLAGRVSIAGAAVRVELSDLHIDASSPLTAGCFATALSVSNGAQVHTAAVRVTNGTDSGECRLDDLIFADDLESGTTDRWSTATGQ